MDVREAYKKLEEEEKKVYSQLKGYDRKVDALFDTLGKVTNTVHPNKNYESVRAEVYAKMDVLEKEREKTNKYWRKIRGKMRKLHELLDEESVIEGNKVDLYKCVLDDRYNYKICLKGSKTVVGEISYRGRPEKLYKGWIGDIGYIISEEYQGNGYASEGLSLLTDKLYKDGIKNVYIAVAHYNAPSHRIAQKFGGKVMEEFSSSNITLYECDLKLIKNISNKR